MTARRAPEIRRRHRGAARGFSLVELLVVIAVLALLAAIAWPSYRDTVLKAQRADARAALLQAAHRLERCHTLNGSYLHPDCAIPDTSPDGHYRLIEPEPRAALAYRLRAVPIGPQAADAGNCAWLELDQRGQRTASGHPGASCW
ncbi:type IV pilin protein [Thioalkalivibrio paradoxus]|uniref:Fimbrial protein pilin n=1 Tax=Thioalkalivibrio paradoxus ARh 1 TaxID=713585 RepID=W0DR66_9GAMM|nr:type IV pilin protein [Thioalkalivibrio paradoxus]AHE99488.1 fimbrial protein pilin [Thioalkalivibrio paradoxus ARh 1]